MKGLGVSPGIAMGKTLVINNDIHIEVRKISEDEVSGELSKVYDTLNRTKNQIEELKHGAERDNNEVMSEIYESHIMILEDPVLAGDIRKKIVEDRFSAEYAVNKSINDICFEMDEIDDEYLRERSKDFRDIGIKLISNMTVENLEKNIAMDEGILIADDLTPYDMANSQIKRITGIATGKGSKTSHIAIIAKSMGIPAVVGVKDIELNVNNDDFVIIDGEKGEVIINPCEDEIKSYKRLIYKYSKEMENLKKYAGQQARTTDGKAIEVFANIGNPKEIEGAVEFGAEGIGLFRTELLFMNRDSMPNEDEQFCIYREAVEKAVEKPVIIRTLDIGGDKEIPYLNLPKEMNPFLGFRAIRICLERENLFLTQLRAILRASYYGDIKIMYPMVINIDEIKKANILLDMAKEELMKKNVPFNKNIEVGIMIETPAAAIISDLLIKDVDFFSIGTNDLTQYTLAVDRGNEKVSNLYQNLHPSILRLIRKVIETSHEEGKKTGMCGEMCSDEKSALLLLGMGLDEFSMSAASIPKIKRMINNVSYKRAKEIVDIVLNMNTSMEINEYLDNVVRNRYFD